MAEQPRHVGFHKERLPLGADIIDGLLQRGMAGFDAEPIHAGRLDSKRGRSFGDMRPSVLCFVPRGNADAIIGDDDQDRQRIAGRVNQTSREAKSP